MFYVVCFPCLDGPYLWPVGMELIRVGGRFAFVSRFCYKEMEFSVEEMEFSGG